MADGDVEAVAEIVQEIFIDDVSTRCDPPIDIPKFNLPCGSMERGEYEGDEIEVGFLMPFEGDIVLDASSSAFTVGLIRVEDANGNDVDSTEGSSISLFDVQ